MSSSAPEREDVGGRLPPQDLDAEQSVLGAMLLSEAAVSEATEVLKAEDFYRGGHGEIFAAMLDLYQGSEPVDQVSVCDRLDQRGSLDQVGGRPAVFALAEAVPVVTNARRYAEIVREMALLRGLIRVGTEVAQLGYDRPGDTRELLDMAEQKVYEISQNGTTEDFTLIKQPLDEAFHRLTLLFEHGDGSGVTGLPTGFGELDRLTSGLQKSNLVILAARPSMGKTSLALNIAEHVAVTLQKPVALFSLEMSKAEIAQRLLCSVGKVDQSRLRLGQLEDGDWMRVTGAMETLGSAPLYIDDSGAMTVMEMRAKARRLAAKQKRQRARAGRRRLHPADAGLDAVRQPRAGDLADLALAEDARARPRRAGARALAALARGRAAPGQAPGALRPARVGRDRAGRRRRHVHLPRRLLPQVGGRGSAPGRPVERPLRADRRPSTATGRSAWSTCASSRATRASSTTTPPPVPRASTLPR